MEPAEHLKVLEDRAFKTYEARVLASKRLARRSRAINASLVSLTVSSTVASIALLVKDSTYGVAGEALLVAVAVVSLAVSLVVPTMNYSGRSKDMFTSYRRIQAFSVEVERVRKSEVGIDADLVRRYSDEYQALLDESENHSSGDYYRTAAGGKLKRYLMLEILVTASIYLTFLVPVALLIPFAAWAINAK